MAKAKPGNWVDSITSRVTCYACGLPVTQDRHTHAQLEKRIRKLDEVLSWSLDIMDMYDERLAGYDGPTAVYTPIHVAGKRKARALLPRSDKMTRWYVVGNDNGQLKVTQDPEQMDWMYLSVGPFVTRKEAEDAKRRMEQGYDPWDCGAEV